MCAEGKGLGGGLPAAGHEGTGRAEGAAPWGSLHGIKPLKLYSRAYAAAGSLAGADSIMEAKYRLSRDKIRLLHETLQFQSGEMGPQAPGQVGLYVGIPFCPSRCEYCSFTMEEAAAPKPETLDAYMAALRRELEYVCRSMEAAGMEAESMYVGGGTPTVLGDDELAGLLRFLRERIPGGGWAELTLEAGRPDTVTASNTGIMRSMCVDRVCINPQSMNAASLAAIGRRHSPDDVYRAFAKARGAGIPAINMDVIAGLPGEGVGDFRSTMEAVWGLGPENISVHTLSLKRGSRLWERAGAPGGRALADGRARAMIGGMDLMMAEKGYRPYYLYRQKYMLDDLENVAYARPGASCIYNMRIMEERQTIIAVGAGAASKVWYPDEHRLERVYNVSNHEVYVDRVDEMIERKKLGMFGNGRKIC